MGVTRRSLLQYAGAACALPLLPHGLQAATSLRRFQVRDTVALPRFAAGEMIIADCAIKGFAGPGLYLYPAWGEPRLYEVHIQGKRLEFRNPGSRALLWTQSAGLESEFAGKVLDCRESPQDADFLANMPVLSVPARPSIA